MAVYIGVSSQGDFLRAEAYEISDTKKITFDNKLAENELPNTGAENNPEIHVGNLIQVISDLIVVKANLQNEHIKGIGIAQSGVVDAKNGILLWSAALNMRNVAIKSEIEQELKIPVHLRHGTASQVLAEMALGQGTKISKKFKDFIFVSAGHGIGSTIFLNGEPYSGATGRAGELGHVTITESGGACLCGSQGCVEFVASRQAILEQIYRRWKVGHETVLAEQFKQFERQKRRIGDIPMQYLLKAAQQDDEETLSAMGQAASAIGIAIKNYVNIMNPEAVLLGGQLFHQNQFLFEACKRIILKECMFDLKAGMEILPTILPTVDARIKGSILGIFQ